MKNNPHLAPRTIREWLDLIPFDRARKEAIENYDPEYHKKWGYQTEISGSLWYAVGVSFDWGDSPQDFYYWLSVWRALKRMEQSVKLKNNELEN